MKTSFRPRHLGPALLVLGTAFQGATAAPPPVPSTQPPAIVAEHGWSALHWAARIGDVEAIRSELNRRADIEARDRLQRTPLHLAVLGVHPEAIQALLAAGADVNARDTWGTTPLRRAGLLRQVRGWSMEAVKQVLAKHGGTI